MMVSSKAFQSYRNQEDSRCFGLQGIKTFELVLDCEKSQSKLYLQPIQKNLSTVSILPQNKSQVKVKCIIFNKHILMKDLRHHVFMCKTKEGLLSSESDDDSLSVPGFTWWRILESSTAVKDVQLFTVLTLIRCPHIMFLIHK